MREIKFRAWIKDENKMILWNADFFSDMSIVTGYSGFFPENDQSVILMQYTGLKDKNNVEIYEGDIIKGDAKYYEIKWNDDRCCFEYCGEYSKNQHSWNLDCDIAFTDKIIGNIHQNPELLK